MQLKRRYDLIPNLVETAKGYMKHERETLEAVIAARNAASAANGSAAATPGDAAAMKDLAGAETALTGALGRLFAVAEAYPDLKANQNMLRLKEELTSTENKIAFARQAYNDAVMAYNTQRETFPTNLVAGMFNFGPGRAVRGRDSRSEREAPKVSVPERCGGMRLQPARSGRAEWRSFKLLTMFLAMDFFDRQERPAGRPGGWSSTSSWPSS